MFLLKVMESTFINASAIVSMRKSCGQWHVLTSCGVEQVVDGDYEELFLNHLNCFNDNIVNIE